MLLELVQGGELLTHLYDFDDTIPKSSFGGFQIDCVQFFAANIILAFEYMHSKNIAYRDLKPDNILLAKNGYVQLADFGFAKRVPPEKTFTICGTDDFMAPEMLQKSGYTHSVDFWALGCVLYELIFASSLFGDAEGYAIKTQGNILRSNRTSITDNFTDNFMTEYPDFFAFLIELLNHEPNMRLGMDSERPIKDDAFFRSISWYEIENQSFKPIYIPTITNSLDTSNFYDYDAEDGVDVSSVNAKINMCDDHYEYAGDQLIFEMF